MPKHQVADLLRFLTPFNDDIRERALWLRDLVWDLYPDTNELIYDNYNALAFGWSLTDKAGSAFCSVAVYGSGVNLGFNRGSEIEDDEHLLIGNGSLYRFIRVTDIETLPVEGLKKLIDRAYRNALAQLKPSKKQITGQTIVKLVSVKKRRPDTFK